MTQKKNSKKVLFAWQKPPKTRFLTSSSKQIIIIIKQTVTEYDKVGQSCHAGSISTDFYSDWLVSRQLPLFPISPGFIMSPAKMLRFVQPFKISFFCFSETDLFFFLMLPVKRLMVPRKRSFTRFESLLILTTVPGIISLTHSPLNRP